MTTVVFHCHHRRDAMAEWSINSYLKVPCWINYSNSSDCTCKFLLLPPWTLPHILFPGENCSTVDFWVLLDSQKLQGALVSLGCTSRTTTWQRKTGNSWNISLPCIQKNTLPELSKKIPCSIFFLIFHKSFSSVACHSCFPAFDVLHDVAWNMWEENPVTHR